MGLDKYSKSNGFRSDLAATYDGPIGLGFVVY